MLSAYDIYAQKTNIPIFFHSKKNLYLQIVFVMEYSSWFYLNFLHFCYFSFIVHIQNLARIF
jgi:hypothetical protein